MSQFCDLYHSLSVHKQLYSGTNSPYTHTCTRCVTIHVSKEMSMLTELWEWLWMVLLDYVSLIPHSDLRPSILKCIKSKRQNELNELPSNTLHSTNLRIDEQHHAGCCQDQVVLSWCCIGHSLLTRESYLRGDYPWSVSGISVHQPMDTFC